VIAPKKIEQGAVPYSFKVRGVHVAPLDSGWYYAFNFDAPTGVKLLQGAAARRLVALKQDRSAVPEIETYVTPEDHLLARHHLIFVRSDPEAYHPQPNRREKRFSVWLHVINGCNFRCFYCYIPHLQSHIDPTEINRRSMSDETALSVIQALLIFCRSNGFSRLHIKFAGGEPSLNLAAVEHFCRSATAAAGNVRVSFGMISNGSFSTKDLHPLLSRYQMQLSLSIDGFRDSHDQIRFTAGAGGRLGTWVTIERNVESLVEFGVKPYLLYTLTKQNASSLYDFACWAHKQGLGFRLSPVRLRRSPSPAETEWITSQLYSLYSWLGKTMPTSLNFERDARFAEWNLHKKKLNACGSCRNYIAVTEMGEIRSCQMSAPSPFNILHHTVDSALRGFGQHPEIATLAQPHLRTGACTECEYYRVCSGGCPQHTLAVHGTRENPSPWCHLFGRMVPVYIEAKAWHLRRQFESSKARAAVKYS
jgi:uncharacterized protein